jgi:lysine/ornithine N-monooxygenase
MAAVIEIGARVSTVTRHGIDKVISRGRAERPFLLAIETADGAKRRELARAVIDASGTWTNPNPLAPMACRRKARQNMLARSPRHSGRLRAPAKPLRRSQDLVVGSGHSAANALLDLVKLAGETPHTEISWAVRGKLERVYGGGDSDQLAARAELGSEVKRIVDSGRVTLIQNFSVTSVTDGTGTFA